jgi:hypothetical protein
VLAVGAGLILGADPRRAIVSLAIVLLVLFGFEGAVHSVHHLGDRDGLARCVVEWAASHLSGAVADADSVQSPAATRGIESPREPFSPHEQRFRLDRNRAPPPIA